MTSYLRTIHGFPPSVRYYILANAGVGIAYFGIFIVLYNLFLLRLGFGQELIGQVNGVGMLCWALLALPASMLGQRFGLRNAQVTGSSIVTVSLALLLLIEWLPEPMRVPWLFATIILQWAGVALFTVNGLPYLVGITTPAERSHAMAVTGSVVALGAVTGNLLAGFLPAQIARFIQAVPQDPAPYRLTLWLVPLFFVFTVYFTARMNRDEQVETKAGNLPNSKAPLMLFLFFGVVIFFQTSSEGAVRAFFNIYLDRSLGMPISQIGMLYAVAGLLPIFGNLLMPLLVRRFGSGGAFALTSLVSTGFLVLIGAVPHPLAAALGFASFNLLTSLLGSIRGVLSQEIVQPLWRTATSAILIMGMAVGWGGMALVGGAIIERIQFRGLMYLSAACAIISISLIYTYLRWNPSSQVARNLATSTESP